MEERIDVLSRRARRLRLRGEYRKASNVYGELTSIEPQRGAWWVLLGVMLQRANRAEQSVKALRQAMFLFRRTNEQRRCESVRAIIARSTGCDAIAA